MTDFQMLERLGVKYAKGPIPRKVVFATEQPCVNAVLQMQSSDYEARTFEACRLWADIQRLEHQARGNQRNFAVLPDLKTRYTHVMLRLCQEFNIKTED